MAPNVKRGARMQKQHFPLAFWGVVTQLAPPLDCGGGAGSQIQPNTTKYCQILQQYAPGV